MKLGRWKSVPLEEFEEGSLFTIRGNWNVGDGEEIFGFRKSETDDRFEMVVDGRFRKKPNRHASGTLYYGIIYVDSQTILLPREAEVFLDTTGTSW